MYYKQYIYFLLSYLTMGRTISTHSQLCDNKMKLLIIKKNTYLCKNLKSYNVLSV